MWISYLVAGKLVLKFLNRPVDYFRIPLFRLYADRNSLLFSPCLLWAYFEIIKGVLHLWALFLKTLCIFSKNKATSDKVSYGSGQKCSKELENYSFTSVETIVVKLQWKMCENPSRKGELNLTRGGTMSIPPPPVWGFPLLLFPIRKQCQQISNFWYFFLFICLLTNRPTSPGAGWAAIFSLNAPPAPPPKKKSGATESKTKAL